MHRIKKGAVGLICSLFFFAVLFTVPAFANNNANTNNSTISVNSGSIPADGSTTATVSITVKDDSNNAISGDTVTLTSSGDSGLVINGGSVGSDTATATTDSNGNVSFTVSSNNPNPGADTFTASDTSDNPAIPLGSNASVTVTFTSIVTPTPSSCNDQAPATPQLTSAVANNDNQITLTWTDAADPVSYYLISYGLTSGQYIYGNPNVGGQGTTSYTVNNLAAGTTYYFVVRAVNGCTPGSSSNEVSATTTGGVIAATPTPVSSVEAASDTNIQNDITPTDTPTPTVTPTATPTPAPTLVAGTSKTQMLIYIIVFILVVGGIGWFIYWKHEKNLKKTSAEPNKSAEETNTEDFFNQELRQSI
jgi:hypothetical protein